MPGLLNSMDWTRMAADLQSIRDDNPVSIEIRRGTTTLPPQTVRLARQGTTNRRVDAGAIEQSEQRVVVLGDLTLDIQKGDRFNDESGELYEVDFVRPNRRAMVLAEARIVQ